MKTFLSSVIFLTLSVSSAAEQAKSIAEATQPASSVKSGNPAQGKDIKVTVKGMVCGFCAQGITKKFKSEPSVGKIDVSLESKVVTIALKDGADLPDPKIRTLLQDAGYTVEKIERPH